MISLIVYLLSTGWAEELSYQQALEQALQNNVQLSSAKLNVKAAQGGVLSARAIFDPQFSTSYGRTFSTSQQFFAGIGLVNTDFTGYSFSTSLQSNFPTGTNFSMSWQTDQNNNLFRLENDLIDAEQSNNPFSTQLSVTITQNLLEGHRISYNLQPLREAQQVLTIAELTNQEQRVQILSDVAKAYWNVRYQRRLESLAQRAIEIAQEEKRIVLAQVQQGNVAAVEADRVEVVVLQAKANLIDIENAKFDATEALLLLLGKPTQTEITLTSSPAPVKAISTDEKKFINAALNGNVTLQKLRRNTEIAEQRLQNARHKYLPDLQAVARYSISGWEDDFSDALDEMWNFDLPGNFIGLTLNVPIANWAERGENTQRIAELQKSQQDEKAMEQSITQQVRTQLRILRAAEMKTKLATANVKLAENNLKTDRALRDAGRNIEKDVLDAIQAVRDAKNQYERAVVDYLVAKIELDRLQGIETK